MQNQQTCEACDTTGVAYWQSEDGAMWKLACPQCVGYLDKDGKTLVDSKGRFHTIEINKSTAGPFDSSCLEGCRPGNHVCQLESEDE